MAPTKSNFHYVVYPCSIENSLEIKIFPYHLTIKFDTCWEKIQDFHVLLYKFLIVDFKIGSFATQACPRFIQLLKASVGMASMSQRFLVYRFWLSFKTLFVSSPVMTNIGFSATLIIISFVTSTRSRFCKRFRFLGQNLALQRFIPKTSNKMFWADP